MSATSGLSSNPTSASAALLGLSVFRAAGRLGTDAFRFPTVEARGFLFARVREPAVRRFAGGFFVTVFAIVTFPMRTLARRRCPV
jgi:hypothetical protein